MSRGIETRMRRLEAKRPPEDLLLVVWGRDEAELARKVEELRASGVIREGDEPLPVIWPLDAPMPESRWAAPREMSDQEIEVLHEALNSEIAKRGEAGEVPV